MLFNYEKKGPMKDTHLICGMESTLNYPPNKMNHSKFLNHGVFSFIGSWTTIGLLYSCNWASLCMEHPKLFRLVFWPECNLMVIHNIKFMTILYGRQPSILQTLLCWRGHVNLTMAGSTWSIIYIPILFSLIWENYQQCQPYMTQKVKDGIKYLILKDISIQMIHVVTI